MGKACIELFEHAIEFVTASDVKAFAPDDLGYDDYVREWQQILASRSLPRRATFEITETVGLTRWADPDREADSIRFRRFRVFTNAVAIGMMTSVLADDDFFPPNYTLISLIDDAAALQDAVLWNLLRRAFVEAHEEWVKQASDESAFAILAVLLVDAQQQASERTLSESADRLIREERQRNGRVHAGFLFGCTYYDQLNDRWREYVDKWIKPASPTLSLVREALLAPHE